MDTSAQRQNSGQWVGRVESETAAPGWAVVELDSIGNGALGRAYHIPDDPAVPSVVVDLGFPQGIFGRHNLEKAPIYTFHPSRGEVFAHDRMPELYPNAWAAEITDLEIEFFENQVEFEFRTPQSEGKGRLFRVPANEPPEDADDLMTWRDFVDFACRNSPGYIFRGQSAPHRLRTSFHRSARKDLVRYRLNDIPEIYRSLACQLRTYFDLLNPEHTGAFYSLIQHHGYPTPLLDWTHSPFVAAFFAFEKPDASATNVRIFVLDRAAWVADLPQIKLVTFTAPHFSIIDVLSLENNRMVPQQATAALTNVDDIEYYIQYHERIRKKKYLRRIDIPVSDREIALAQLRLMGITAGSLFPGLDGTCRAMAAKNF
jgi:hypothetical protein